MKGAGAIGNAGGDNSEVAGRMAYPGPRGLGRRGSDSRIHCLLSVVAVLLSLLQLLPSPQLLSLLSMPQLLSSPQIGQPPKAGLQFKRLVQIA